MRREAFSRCFASASPAVSAAAKAPSPRSCANSAPQVIEADELGRTLMEPGQAVFDRDRPRLRPRSRHARRPPQSRTPCRTRLSEAAASKNSMPSSIRRSSKRSNSGWTMFSRAILQPLPSSNRRSSLRSMRDALARGENDERPHRSGAIASTASSSSPRPTT